MPNVSGKIIFNSDCNADANDFRNRSVTRTQITLRNTQTGIGKVAYTALDGSYKFIDVPNGTYTVVESTITKDSLSVVYFTDAEYIPPAIPGDPDIFFATNTYYGTNLNSLSPNVITITINNADLNDINFIDAPIIEVSNPTPPILIGSNLITLGDNGTFGSLPEGTLPETSPDTSPYTNILPNTAASFTYQKFSSSTSGITVNHYSITNIIATAYPPWWSVADHTTKDERGRMLVLACQKPSSIFFKQTISVKPNTAYHLSLWLCNLSRDKYHTVPNLTFLIKDSNGQTIFSKEVQEELRPKNVPTWVEIYSDINSRNNLSLTLEFLYTGIRQVGEDFLVDDISFTEVNTSPNIQFIKSVDKKTTTRGNILTYNIDIRNIGPILIEGILFIDTIPTNTSLISDSTLINNIKYPNPLTPNSPIIYSNNRLPSNTALNIQYKVKTYNSLPENTIISNKGFISYSFIKSSSEIEKRTLKSNEVSTTIVGEEISLVCNKYVSKSNSYPCGILNYFIKIINNTGITLNDVVLTEIFNINLIVIKNSLFINNRRILGCPDMSKLNLKPISPNQVVTIKYSIRVPSNIRCNFLMTYSNISYRYTKDSAAINSECAEVQSNIVTTILDNHNKCTPCNK